MSHGRSAAHGRSLGGGRRVRVPRGPLAGGHDGDVRQPPQGTALAARGFSTGFPTLRHRARADRRPARIVCSLVAQISMRTSFRPTPTSAAPPDSTRPQTHHARRLEAGQAHSCSRIGSGRVRAGATRSICGRLTGPALTGVRSSMLSISTSVRSRARIRTSSSLSPTAPRESARYEIASWLEASCGQPRSELNLRASIWAAAS
jgi:hypothetical protein